MGGGSLRASACVAASHGRSFGRHLRPPKGIRRRCCALHVASVWCGLAPDIRHLILARGLQGVGGALARSRQPGSHQCQFSRGAARPRDWRVVWIHVDHSRDRSRSGWVVHRARVVEMGVFHQCPIGAGRPGFDSVEGPGKQNRRSWSTARLAGRAVGGTRLRRNRFRSDSVHARRGYGWRSCPDWTAVLGSPLNVAHGSVPVVSFHEFQPAPTSSHCSSMPHWAVFSSSSR